MKYDNIKKGLQFTYLGMTMVIIVGLCVGGGYYLDTRWNTQPTFTVVGVVVGIISGLGYFILEIYRLVSEGLDDDEEHDR